MEPLQRDILGYRLLYVDDDERSINFISKIITRRYPGLKLFIAENGAKGLELYREQRPDIVLTDMYMPVMDGIQMANEIRTIDAEAVIIAVTGYDDPSYLHNAIEIGIRHYVMKPLIQENLFAVIDKSIEEISLNRLVREQGQVIRQREQQLALAQKITRLGSWELDIESGKMSWSEELYRIFGIDPATTTPSLEVFLGMVHPTARDKVKMVIQNAVKNGQPFISHYCGIVRPDGSNRKIHCNGDVIFDTAGKPAAVIGTAQDVTERRQTEEVRARLAMIVESSDDAIFSVSLDDTITSWNRGAENVFGYSASEIIGRTIFTLIPPERYDERSHILQKIMNGERLQHFETVRIKKDGSRINVSITTSPLLNANGKVIGNSVIARDVTERRMMEEVIKHRAYHDPLTDLPNRQLFMDFFSMELAEARRNGKKLALLFLDLNGFKQVNDTLGHSCGDLLLQEVAQRLRACIRESDTVARLGGDEFTVLMPDLAQTDDVGVVLKKILGVFDTPFMLGDVAVNSTTSIGICMFPDDGECSEELMKKADTAMYDAKSSGRNAYQFYNAEINARTIKRQNMERFLRQAVDRSELELLFQPQVSSETRGIIGAEALLRWRHPEQGLLPPDQFLAIAEDSGAIVPIGEWVIRNACDQARIWNEKGYPLSVSVNLSNRQFHQSDLIEKIARILAETGLNSHQLEFDITEKAIMADTVFSLRSMHALTEIGVTLAIDNFGCGSSSIQWMRKMPIHKVIIDKSFVHTMLSEPDDLAVINAVIAMSHNLRINVGAIGIETKEQLSVIERSGCDQLQGYVISEPLSADDFERFVVGF